VKKLLYILFLFLGFLLSAQGETLFNKANEAYNTRDYDKAIENYLKVLENGQHSSELYFNLGNAYYKLNLVAPSIYYYEKALLLKPDDSEIKNNLAYAQNMTLDAIETMPETGIAKIYENVVGFLNFEQWGYTAIVLIFLFVILYIAFYYFTNTRQKRIAFVTSLVSLVIALVSLVFAFLKFADFQANQPAIVFANEVIVKSEPNERSQLLFTLHEGTKLNVLEELEGYKKIQIADGQTGWLSSESIKILKDF